MIATNKEKMDAAVDSVSGVSVVSVISVVSVVSVILVRRHEWMFKLRMKQNFAI